MAQWTDSRQPWVETVQDKRLGNVGEWKAAEGLLIKSQIWWRHEEPQSTEETVPAVEQSGRSGKPATLKTLPPTTPQHTTPYHHHHRNKQCKKIWWLFRESRVWGLEVAAGEKGGKAQQTALKGISSVKEPWPASDARDAGTLGASRQLESGSDISGNCLACQQRAFTRPGFGSTADCAQSAFPTNIMAI